ncbi:CRISPR-associated endonuclease Cas3'' [Marivibrio halodurans]|uniref:CRISPR-associated endonuclease Cas3 n=1 Tax=Marivibrio halodurans TaxID=2039722 RepID=A0A8J7SK07_9PROT|nr:CRISPR-associated endonuclease Cas3'' [Marivibrio halodurans]MBP5855918.1 CRISPR-associated endonuclease Cas3'' [Marivibrio halodurans]
MTEFAAHSPPKSHPDAAWHGLREHLEGTARHAADLARPFGGETAAALGGLLHDLGKYDPAFQAYIRGQGPGPEHAIAGAAWLWHAAGSGEEKLVARLLAHAVAGHHAGLPDTDAALGGLRDRVNAVEDRLDPSWREEIAPDTAGISPRGFTASGRNRVAFELAFLGRMLFSALVDADFKDTEAYYSAIEGRTPDRAWPALGDILPDLRARFDAHMAGIAVGREKRPVDDLRREVLKHVRAQADRPPDSFTLTVPTGGGKTLTSLGFALDHARAHGLRRIVYAIPFTSIIDQTAAIFKEVLGEDVVLEHHCAIEQDGQGWKARAARDKLRLAMEDWAAPVVVTTHVQLFESLFAARPARCRKLQALAGAVIVLDEAQTLPLGLLKPGVAALRELVRSYGASLVLCTATQPALDRGHFTADPLMGLETAGKELAPDPAHLARRLRRTRFRHAGPMDDAALIDALAETDQGLVIVNSRPHALALYRAGRAAALDGLIHLSTRQCAAHRRAILAEVRARLEGERPCRVVATSLVEAGVDVDFPHVWRAEAGLEQVVQAAGRCNREGKRAAGDSIVTVFRAPDHPAPRELRRNAEIFARLIEGGADWTAPETVERYFRELYWTRGPEALDRHGLLDRFKLDIGGPSFAYRSVAEDFRMVADTGAPVIIPDPANAEILADLDNPRISSGALARRLQTWIVQPPGRERQRLIDLGAIYFAGGRERADQFAVLSTCHDSRAEPLYTRETGLIWEADPGAFSAIL